MGLSITTVVCAYNESRLLAGCLYSLRAQTRQPDDILVINNASTDETGAVARAVPGVRVVTPPTHALVHHLCGMGAILYGAEHRALAHRAIASGRRSVTPDGEVRTADRRPGFGEE